jgi:hypothetical protein
MKFGLKLLISILLLASISLVVGDQLIHSTDLAVSTPNLQIDHGADSSPESTNGLASEEKVFVGSIKSNKYHYPSCSAAKKNQTRE